LIPQPGEAPKPVAPVPVIKISAPEVSGYWEVPVLYVDAHLLVLDKPAGLALTSGTALEPGLLPLLHEGIKAGKPWARELDLSYLMPPYRLDAEVGGVQLFGRSREVLSRLHDLFGAGKPHLVYQALAQGDAQAEEFEQDDPLTTEPDARGKYHCNRRGKQSRTRFRVLERFGSHTWVECEPCTHRVHQVRVHLARRRMALAGDVLYGGQPLLLSRIKHRFRLKPGHAERPLLSRPALHAVRVAVPHPAGGAPVEAIAPLPHDLEAALRYLRRHRAVGGEPE
jgi:23S rRNA-/tRNA-specific pseudouridylate synthase